MESREKGREEGSPIPGPGVIHKDSLKPGSVVIQEDAPKPECGVIQEDAPKPECGVIHKDSPNPMSGVIQEDSPNPMSGVIQEDSPKPDSGVNYEDLTKLGSGFVHENSPKPKSGIIHEGCSKPGSVSIHEDSPKPSSEFIHEGSSKSRSGVTYEGLPIPGSGFIHEDSSKPVSGVVHEGLPKPGSGFIQEGSPKTRSLHQHDDTQNIKATKTTAADLITTSSTTTPQQESAQKECGKPAESSLLSQCTSISPTGGDNHNESPPKKKSSTATDDRPVPPNSLPLSGSRPRKKKVLVAPALSLSLGRSDSTLSDDFTSAFLSPSTDDDDDMGLEFDLDAMETPSDSESLPFPNYDLDLEDELHRLGVASHRRAPGSSSRFGSGSGSTPAMEQGEPSCLEQEDTVDEYGTRWRCFSTGEPPQDSRVNMSVLEPYLRVLSHGGYYGDGMNDIIVFSSCYLPENRLENYPFVMDSLFRYVVGTLDLMVAKDYVIVYLCAGGQRDKLPGISWLRDCYTTIDRKLRKNLKGFYVVHPTWYIKALITIIKPFISSKFSKKLQFVDSLQHLSHFIPTEYVQIPDCVKRYDRHLSR
ncbi:bcl-2/adenovirus E1B 19 kDa-interacting protein 2-like protein isoform X2 [Thalassophryne amazonica]|nr:bcl-2/adenovirus E1B 19 kDa-interacting protein 2-like protein isoform X2 [Thalassophryne amazonica]